MHAVVMENLEEYLAGTLEPADRREIEAHLSACEDCREEMSEMQEVSRMFVSLRPEEEWQPSPGFYAGVVDRLEVQVARPWLASWFSLDFVFGRRLAFAALVMFAVLGSYLVTRETSYPTGPSPASLMAQENSPQFDSGSGHDHMLVTMTAYEQR